ncbi:unnamed protein product [Choristocarpus tenellus]
MLLIGFSELLPHLYLSAIPHFEYFLPQHGSSVQVSPRQSSLPALMVTALKGNGLEELQRELSALDPNPAA